MQFSPISCHFISLRSKYSPQHPVRSLCSYLNVRDQVFHPYRTRGKFFVCSFLKMFLIFICFFRVYEIGNCNRSVFVIVKKGAPQIYLRTKIQIILTLAWWATASGLVINPAIFCRWFFFRIPRDNYWTNFCYNSFSLMIFSFDSIQSDVVAKSATTETRSPSHPLSLVSCLAYWRWNVSPTRRYIPEGSDMLHFLSSVLFSLNEGNDYRTPVHSPLLLYGRIKLDHI
jgi:hypothetical protein